MSADRSFRLDSREAVDCALVTRLYLRVFPPRLVVEAPGLEDDARRTLQARIDRLADECGCSVGAAFALLALGTYVIYASMLAPPAMLGHAVIGGVVVFFAGATAGKLAGIGRARAELRHVLIGLRESIAW